MFSSQVERARSPFSAKNPGVVLGCLVLASAVTALFNARAIPYVLAAVVAGTWAYALALGRAQVLRMRFNRVVAAGAAFLIYASVSGAWAIDPALTLQSAFLAAVIGAASASAFAVWRGESRQVVLRGAEGLWLGLALGLLYMLVEIVSGQAIKMWLYNLLGFGAGHVKANWFKFREGRIVHIAFVELTRNATPVPLLLWPALMAVLGAVAPRSRWPVAAVIAASALVAVALSPSESAKVAIVLGAVFGAAALALRRAVWVALGVLWAGACLLVVPGALLAHDTGLHHATWLPNSARDRVVIWNYTAEETLKAPFFGVGAVTTYVIGQTIKPAVAQDPGEGFERRLSQHAHNVYLQVWYELGAAGAVLLLAFGLTILCAARKLPEVLHPAAAATLASGMAIAATSYGLWQPWFLAMYGLCAVAFCIGAQALTSRPDEIS